MEDCLLQIALIAPGKFRELDAVMAAELSGCTLEVLNVAVQQSGDHNLESTDESSSIIVSPDMHGAGCCTIPARHFDTKFQVQQ